jgi:hypothetical protein
MRKNVASQTIAFQMTLATDGTTAVTSGTPTVYYTVDGGTQGTGAGTSTHEGNGQWSYVPAQAETNGDHVIFTMVLATAITQAVNVYPVSYDPTSASLGLNNFDPAADTVALVTTVTTLTGHTAQTGDSFAIVNGASGSVATKAVVDAIPTTAMRGTDSAYTGTPPTANAIADQVWDELQSAHVTAGSFGIIASEIAAIPTTAMRGTDSAATAASLATAQLDLDKITGVSGVIISSAVRDSIAVSLLDLANGIETSSTLRESLRLILSAMVGKCSGADTNAPVYRDRGDTVDRITAVTDSDGNRTSVTTNDT